MKNVSNKKIEIILAKSWNGLKIIEKEDSIIIENISLDSVSSFISFIDSCAKVENRVLYVVKGSILNLYYNRFGEKRFDDKLTLCCLPLIYIKEPEKLKNPPFSLKEEWFFLEYINK